MYGGYKKMDLVILAAGMGSRFGGLKQIEPMDEFGNFIIDYSIYDAIEAGFDRVIFIIKEELLDDFRNTIGKRIEKKIETIYAFQGTKVEVNGKTIDRVKPWGTAHALMCAQKYVKSNFIIINSDDYYGKESFKVAAKYLQSLNDSDKGKYANVAFQASKTLTENGSVKRGICFANDEGYLNQMIESSIEKKENGEIIASPLDTSKASFTIEAKQHVSMNMFIFTKDIFNYLDQKFNLFLKENEKDLTSCEFLIPTVVTELIHEGNATVKLLSTPSTWYGVTYYKDKENVVSSLQKLVKEGKYKKGLWS